MARRTKSTGSEKEDLLLAYRRGTTYMREREQAAGLGKRQPKLLKVLPYNKRCLFGKDPIGKQIAQCLADRFGVDEKIMRADAKFAEAVDTIVCNCGPAAKQALLSVKHVVVTRKSIMELSGTSADRQQYRIAGSLAGRFKSITIQGNDPVFDTVAFKEVLSRLRRARGSLIACRRRSNRHVSPSITAECAVLAELCLRAAEQLGLFLSAQTPKELAVPKSLRRNLVQQILDSREVIGYQVGYARLALKLTIKSVWDYKEMYRRGISPTPAQQKKTREELAKIIATAKAILMSGAKPMTRRRK